MIWKIALRNLLKSPRRSFTTAGAIAIGGLAALLFGGFITSIWFGVQTSMIQQQGQLQVHKQGYLEFGAADPDAYTIKNWTEVAARIAQDPALSADISVMTPVLRLGGIAGNAETGVSKTFIGMGVVPSAADEMRKWDGWNMGQTAPATGLSDAGLNTVIVGRGMARMMGLCAALSVPDCQDPPTLVTPAEAGTSEDAADFAALISSEESLTAISENAARNPVLNLLAAASTGAPNIARVEVAEAQSQAQRAVDNAFVMLHFETARDLLYGDSPEASSLLIQLHDPAKVEMVKASLQTMLNGTGLGLEVLKFNEVDPTFDRVFGMFSFLFGVISLVLSVVIIFTILNTISMTIVERTREIGTIRAIGFRRGFIQRLFLAESLILGAAGAGLALILAGSVSTLVNTAGIQWTPPNNATPLTVQLMVFDNPVLSASILAALVVIAVVASLMPTRRAARMSIVSALHHA